MVIGIVGKPGSGKSTIGAAIVRKNNKKKEKYYKRIEKSKLFKWLDSRDGKIIDLLMNLLYSKNFYDVIYSTDPSIQDTIGIEYDTIGFWEPTPNSLFLLEEAGVSLHGRDYKALKKETRAFFALHRHKYCDIVVISQTPNYDKTLRTLSEVMLIARKIGPFTWYHRIPYKIEVDKEKHDIVEGYYVLPLILDLFEAIMTAIQKRHRLAKLPVLRSTILFRPIYYKYFNSYIDTRVYPMIAPDKQGVTPIDESSPEDSPIGDSPIEDSSESNYLDKFFA